MKNFIAILVIGLLYVFFLPFKLLLSHRHRERFLDLLMDALFFGFINKFFSGRNEGLKNNDSTTTMHSCDYNRHPLPPKITAHGNPLKVVYPTKIIQDEFFLIFQQPTDYKEEII